MGNPKSRRSVFRNCYGSLAGNGNSLQEYYETNFALMQHHKYSLTELDNLLPWEKEIYVGMLSNHIKEENERRRREAKK